jgi:hypothetical protein
MLFDTYFVIICVLILRKKTDRWVVSGKEYLRLAVSGYDWPPDGYYKYHWLV